MCAVASEAPCECPPTGRGMIRREGSKELADLAASSNSGGCVSVTPRSRPRGEWHVRTSPSGGNTMKARSEAALIGVVIYQGVEPIDVGGTAGVVSMASRVLP